MTSPIECRIIQVLKGRNLIFLRFALQYIALFQDYLVFGRTFFRFVILHKDGVKPLFDYERFEALRISRGITKRFIASSLGRSATLVQDWKLQKSQPSETQLAEVARILGTTPAYLRGETDEVSPESPQDEELRALLEELREREEMRMLFKLARDASPEDVRQAVRIIEALRRDD